MVNDQEPRYRLVDADGNVVGSFFAESDGTLKMQEGTSGNNNELALDTQGSLQVDQITATKTLTDVTMLNSQTIPSNDSTRIEYDTPKTDELNGFDATNHTITVPADGRYLITGYGTWFDDPGWTTGDDARLRPRVNGSSVVFGTLLKVSTNQQGVQIPTVVRDLTAGDEIDIEAFQDSGGDKILGGGEEVQRFMVARIG